MQEEIKDLQYQVANSTRIVTANFENHDDVSEENELKYINSNLMRQLDAFEEQIKVMKQ